MKIIKNSTYIGMTEEISELTEKLDHSESCLKSVGEKLNYQFELNERCPPDKIVLVGQCGSGKTHFLQNVLMKNLHDPYIIARVQEYNSPHDIDDFFDKYSNFDIRYSDKRTIVIDCLSMVGQSGLPPALVSLSNFIYVAHSFRQISQVIDQIDLIYDFGVPVSVRERIILKANEHKVINMHRYAPHNRK